MSSIPWLVDVLADAFRGDPAFRVETYAGHERRAARSASFSPVGVLDHHTGSSASYNAILAYMAQGSSIAPLCHYATSPPTAGVVRVTVVATGGRANHAGAGIYLPAGIGRNQGNYRLIGAEHHNDGRTPWPSQQIEAARRAAAAILTYLGRAPDPYLLDHKTYAPGRKVDRHTLDVNTERVAVARIMNRPQENAMAKLPTRLARAWKVIVGAGVYSDGTEHDVVTRAELADFAIRTGLVLPPDPDRRVGQLPLREWNEALTQVDTHPAGALVPLEELRERAQLVGARSNDPTAVAQRTIGK